MGAPRPLPCGQSGEGRDGDLEFHDEVRRDGVQQAGERQFALAGKATIPDLPLQPAFGRPG